MKNYLALFILLISTALTFGQTFQWQGAIGGNDLDYPNSIWVDINGNAYLTGNYYSTNLKHGNQVIATNVYGAPMNFFLVKIDSNGNPVFARDAQYTSDAIGLEVRTDSSLNIYNLVINNSFFWLTIDNDTFWSGPSGAAALLLKYDSNGDFLWGKTFSNEESFGTAAAMDIIDDNNIIACSSNIEFIFDSTGNVSSINDNLKICDFDSTGSIKWTKSLINIPNIYKIEIDRHENINILCNKQMDSLYVDSQFIAADSFDYFMIRFSKNGDFIEYIPFRSYDDIPYIFFTIDRMDNIYFTGVYNSPTFHVLNLPTQQKMDTTNYSREH